MNTVMPGSQAPFLTAWFEIMDSDEPSRVLELISADFTFAILFSIGGDATDFAGGRPVLEHYLEQREKGTRTHHRLAATTAGRNELFLGEVRRAGVPEATFVAAGQLTGDRLLRRLLIGRSPAVLFDSADVIGGVDVQLGIAGRPAT